MGARWLYIIPKYPVHHPFDLNKVKSLAKSIVPEQSQHPPTAQQHLQYAYPCYWWQWTDWPSRHR